MRRRRSKREKTIQVFAAIRMAPNEFFPLVERAFELWNDKDNNRRFHEVQVLVDITEVYQLIKQIRSAAERSSSFIQPAIMKKKPKRRRSNSIKCKPYNFGRKGINLTGLIAVTIVRGGYVIVVE